MTAKIITYINEKGGVGKSSITFNTAYELASRGKKILMIDIDGQKANLSFFAGIGKSDYTLIDILKDGKSIESVCIPIHVNIDLIPANASVSGIGMDSKVSTFRKELNKIKSLYDYIFIDVTPSPGWAHYLSLSVSDYAVIVMLPDVASLEGNSGIIESIEEIQETTNTNLKIAGILFNRNNNRISLGQQVLSIAEQMAKKADTKIFDSKIPQAISLSECIAVHEGITAYDPKSKAADAFRYFVNELEEVVK